MPLINGGFVSHTQPTCPAKTVLRLKKETESGILNIRGRSPVVASPVFALLASSPVSFLLPPSISVAGGELEQHQLNCMSTPQPRARRGNAITPREGKRGGLISQVVKAGGAQRKAAAACKGGWRLISLRGGQGGAVQLA